MSGEMQAVVPDLESVPAITSEEAKKDVPDPAVPTEKEKTVAKTSGAASFDRLVEVNMRLTQAVNRLVKISYLTQLVLVLVMVYLLTHK